jgi:hypothetical protein
LSEALDRMTLRGLHQLPVVARDNSEYILGLIEREQVKLICSLAVTQKALQEVISH